MNIKDCKISEVMEWVDKGNGNRHMLLDIGYPGNSKRTCLYASDYAAGALVNLEDVNLNSLDDIDALIEAERVKKDRKEYERLLLLFGKGKE